MYKKSEKLKLIRRGLEAGNLLGVALRNAGVKSYYTLDLWRRRPLIDRYVAKCQTKGYERRVHAVEDALFKSAIEGNTTAMIFFLTNKAMNDWADRRNLVHSGKVEGGNNITIIYPSKDNKKIKEEKPNAQRNRILLDS